jgi:ribosomal protein S27AE
MSAEILLAELRSRGVTVEPLPNGNLYLTPKERVDEALAERVRAAKPEIRQLLGGACDFPRELCRTCGEPVFWRTRDGRWICARCHPPVENVAVERFELARDYCRADWRAKSGAPNSRHPLVPQSIREKIERIESEARAKGWPAELLWNSDFWSSPRGLAAVLDEDDELGEVTADYIEVLKREKRILKFQRFH